MPSVLPQFTSLDPTQFTRQLEELLARNLKQIDALVAANVPHTWDNLMQPLESMEDELERLWSPVSHLHAVVNSPELRDCYQACLPKLSAYEAAIGHNKALYAALTTLDPQSLNSVQRKILKDTLRNFTLSGVALPVATQHRFEALQTQLSTLSNQFENNVLDAGQAWELHILEASRLDGLPEHAIHHAATLAQEKELDGWMLNLEFPCYLAVVTYAQDRALRETMYHAFVTRASDEGPFAGQFDNTMVMNDILALRHEKAQLLGFKNYAELSLATKMASSTDEVIGFLSDLCTRAHPQAREEFRKLQQFARETLQLDTLEPWDIAYAAEKKQHARYAISQEELRPYFPLPQVMDGMFSIIHTLYGMTLEAIDSVDVWHPDVTCYRVVDSTQKTRGYVYIDLFARPQKRGGAWMDSLQGRRKLPDGSIQLPIATLTCNFAKPVANQPATLSHDEVLTLFHEMGHGLHHLLTQVDYASAAGINGVEWDAVELPSQFFENWCWEYDALQRLSRHVKTGEPISQTLFEKLRAAKNFQSAMGMMRQLEFSLFDFRIHEEYQPNRPAFVTDTLAEVRKIATVVPIMPYNRFQHSFTHIFGGGYAAGYYSYKWAEVLSSDAFSRFEEEGLFNEKTGRDFLHAVLEAGSSHPAAEAYVAFRGRPATIDALLRHNGIHTQGVK